LFVFIYFHHNYDLILFNVDGAIPKNDAATLLEILVSIFGLYCFSNFTFLKAVSPCKPKIRFWAEINEA
jgi:hypothetical protein